MPLFLYASLLACSSETTSDSQPLMGDSSALDTAASDTAGSDTAGSDTAASDTAASDSDGVPDAEDCNPQDPDVSEWSAGFSDLDGDGYGNPDSPYTFCGEIPAGYVSNDRDCDDSDDMVFPGSTELCNNADDDCDDIIDEDPPIAYVDMDFDGYGSDSWSMEVCELPKGYSRTNDDCDDTNAEVNPGAQEICNEIDDDCDTYADDSDPDGVSGQSTWNEDSDGDGFGNEAVTTESCAQPTGFVANTADGNSEAKPGQTVFQLLDRGDGSYDYDCDNIETLQYEDYGSCSVDGGYCSLDTEGWDQDPAECGKSGAWLVSCGDWAAGTHLNTEWECPDSIVNSMFQRCL
jgi:hypothetical protein